MTELRFGPDGYLDLSDLPDGDPDTVLPADELAALHDALLAGHPDLDDGVWDGLVHAAVTGDGDDPLDVAVPGVEAAPFEVDGWPPGDHEAHAPDPHDDHDDHDDPDPDHGPGAFPEAPADPHDHDDPLDVPDDDTWAVTADVDDAYHLDLDLSPDHDGHDVPGDDALVPDEDEHYDF